MDLFIGLDNFKQGFYALEDTTKAPFGAARIMKNCQITDRGGIAPRPGTSLLGTYNTSAFTNKGFYNFVKSFNANEILMKSYDTHVEVYSKNHTGANWFRLKSTYTSDKEFGFVSEILHSSQFKAVALFQTKQKSNDMSEVKNEISTIKGILKTIGEKIASLGEPAKKAAMEMIKTSVTNAAGEKHDMWSDGALTEGQPCYMDEAMTTPCPAGDYTTEDGTVVTCDDKGICTKITPATAAVDNTALTTELADIKAKYEAFQRLATKPATIKFPAGLSEMVAASTSPNQTKRKNISAISSL